MGSRIEGFEQQDLDMIEKLMRKKALRKDFRMELKKSKNRFISIFAIVAMGVAFYTGIQATAPDMLYSGDTYFDMNQLMDIKVMGSMGLTDEDMEALAALDGIRKVEPGYMTDAYWGGSDSAKVLRVESVSPTMNKLTADMGRLPEKAGEIFLDIEFVTANGLEIGDEVVLVEEADWNKKDDASGEADTKDADDASGETDADDDADDDHVLAQHTYTLVGAGSSPLYIAFVRGNTTLGTGELEGTAFIMPEDFDYDIYTQAYLQVEGSDTLNAFSDAYDDVVARMIETVEGIAPERCQIRYDEVMAEANEELADAKKELEDGKREADEELEEAWQEILDAEAELADGEQELADALIEIEDNKELLREKEVELADAKADLADGERELVEGAAEFEENEAKFNDEYPKALKELEGAEAAVSKAAGELSAGWAEYEAGASQLADAQIQIDSGKEQIASAKAALSSGWAEYNAGAAELKVKEQELIAGEQEFSTAIDTIKAGLSYAGAGDLSNADADMVLGIIGGFKSRYESAVKASEEANQAVSALLEKKQGLEADSERLKAEIAELETQQSGSSRLEEAKEELSNVQAELGSVNAQLEEAEKAAGTAAAGKAQASAMWTPFAQQYELLVTTNTQLKDGRTQLEAGKQQLASAKAKLEAGQSELDANEAQLKAAQSQIDEKRLQLEEAKAQLESGQSQISENAKKLKEARKELEDAKAELEDARLELWDAKLELDDAKAQIADGEQQIADGWQEIADAEADIADARAELEDGKKELADGKIEYEDGKREAEEEIADAEEKIADAEKEISEIEMAEWTVEDRGGLPEHIGYSDNAQRIDNIGEVFPVLFFLIAALISLTTMTRMVEEERTQIGTLKALGYSKLAIASKYLKYAIFATIGGSILGLLIGEKIIPYVIIDAYGIMYTHMNEIKVPYQFSHGVIATAMALVSTVGATWAACSKSLAATPAVLMRPPAPKEGKRVLLEYLPFIWNRLSFSWKSTIRNMMRYKKRVFMTVFGISGCMGLIITGYGISDSIMGIASLQYEQLQHYDVMLIGEDEVTDEEKSHLRVVMDENENIENYASVLMQTMTVPDGKKEHTLYLIVPENVEEFGEFLTFRDRNTHESYSLVEEGVIAAEKIMNLVKKERGEALTIEDEDGISYSVPVSEICENYMSHYLYMTPEYYRQVFGKEPVYDEVMVQMADMSEEEMEAVGESLLEEDGVLSVSYTRTIMDQLEYMLTALDAVIIVLIVSAGMLAFVVLYNLNNININERKREMATLKVLGFFDGEVSAYVYRENILLTLIGIVFGFVMGKIMHRFIIVTVEVDMCMFGRNIDPPSYLIAAAFTMLFSFIVNWVMHYKLKRIDMVESLKSVE